MTADELKALVEGVATICRWHPTRLGERWRRQVDRVATTPMWSG